MDKKRLAKISLGPAGLAPFIAEAGGGDCGGGGGGGSPGCGTACGGSAGCSSCGGGGFGGGNDSCSGSGGCTCASSSTPFLYVQEQGDFLMDNDVMFGKPSSLFGNIESGIEAYRAGEIKSDLYLVQKPITTNENGEVKLQIREIEPEVSAIFSTSLSRLPKKDRESIYATSDFSGCVRTDSTEETKITVTDSRGIDLSSALCEFATNKEKNKMHSVTLETGDYLDLVFNADNVKGRYLIMESWYRDWTLGMVYSNASESHFVVSPYGTAAKYAKRGALTSLTAILLGFLGLNGSLGQKERELIAGSFGLTNVAYADTPHYSSSSCSGRSLEVSYRDTVTNSKIDVVEPRYARPYSVAIKIPQGALIDGQVRLRITATKRHKISNLKVVSGSRVPAEQFETLTLKNAYHHREKKDYVNTLREKNNDYLKTYPSDIVTLTFATEKNQEDIGENKYHYLLNIGGVYAPASREDQAVVGDWVPRLDSEAKDFIATVYKDSFGGDLKFKDKEA